jgi:hypothetical protein
MSGVYMPIELKSNNIQTNTTSNTNHKRANIEQITSHNKTQTNTVFNTNNRSANVAQTRHISYYDNTPTLHPATTTEGLALLKQG